MIQLDWPPFYALALVNPYQTLDLYICVPSAWKVVPLHLHGVVVFYSSPWPHCTCYVLREDIVSVLVTGYSFTWFVSHNTTFCCCPCVYFLPPSLEQDVREGRI